MYLSSEESVRVSRGCLHDRANLHTFMHGLLSMLLLPTTHHSFLPQIQTELWPGAFS